jgi:hypothetical protein
MSTVAEIQDAIEKLPAKEKAALTVWMQSHEEPLMSPEQERALLASLDRAAQELDSGKGVPVKQVREMVAKWAGK